MPANSRIQENSHVKIRRAEYQHQADDHGGNTGFYIKYLK